MEAGISSDNASISRNTSRNTPASRETAKSIGGIFTCSFCSLKENYDYKGAKPPFARQLIYSEDCYIMKDPFSLPNSGEVLVLGADCDICKQTVCLGCSIFYTKRFCPKCAVANMQNLPPQLHAKIKNSTKHESA